MKTIGDHIAGILIFLALAIIIAAGIYNENHEEQSGAELSVTILNPAGSEAVIIQHRDSTIVLDTCGDDGCGELISILDSRKIKQVDKLVITGAEHERISGADEMIEKFSIGEICVPAGYEKHTAAASLISNAHKKGVRVRFIDKHEEHDLGDATLHIHPNCPDGSGESAESGFCTLTVTAIHFENDLLLSGEPDALINAPAGYDLIAVEADDPDDIQDIEAIVKEDAPDVLIICDSKNDSSDHQAIGTEKFTKTRVFRTSDDPLYVSSDGKVFSVGPEIRDHE